MLTLDKTRALAMALLGVPLLAVALLPTPSRGTTVLADAAATYKAKCAACHGADGSGSTPTGKSLKVRDLRGADIKGMSDDALYNVIAKGKGKMPAYEKSLGADQCKALVAYIRQLK
jgi:mono/diheme cytochrome c family protein